MKTVSLVISAPYQSNRVFDPKSPLNRDNCLAFFRHLRESFKQKGYEIQTCDLLAPQEADLVIYNDMPAALPRAEDIQKSVLIIYESPIIMPQNWEPDKHRYFGKIFTWSGALVDNKKYFKNEVGYSGDKQTFIRFQDKNEFLTMVAGYHDKKHPLGLYLERIRAVRFFDKNYPEKFKFYGFGWDRYIFRGPKIIRALNKIPGLGRVLAPKWNCYAGKADSKAAIFRNFKFAICFENGRDIPDYITEKIFDCLSAGCIPIYWGAPNIVDYIPKDCFVDCRDFTDYNVLYEYLLAMSESEYNSRLQSIEAYLKSEKHLPFTPRWSAEHLVKITTGIN